MNDTCALCHAHPVTIEESHILPAWSYKRVVNYAPGSGAPVVVDEEVVLQSSKQAKRPLLCRDCEQRFSTVENSVSKLVVQEDGTFPLRDGAKQVDAGPDGYQVLELLEQWSRDLAYFGLSVVWRADVAQIEPVVSLGPEVREGIRAFLLDTTVHPPAAVALTVINPPRGVPRIDRIVTFPQTEGAPHEERHEFLCCGVRFSIVTGDQARASFSPLDAVTGRLAFGSAGHGILRSVVEAAKAATPKGKLAAKYGTKS